MATTYWVDPVDGSDAAAGTSFAAAVKTLPIGFAKLIIGGVGSTLNLVNTGSHTWPLNASETALSNLAGSSWSSFGALIRGTDSNGNSAFVTIAPTAAGAKRLVNLQSTAKYLRFENILWDASSQSADSASYNIVRSVVSNLAGPVRFRYCALIGGASGTVSAGERALFESTGTQPNDAFVLDHVYFQNCQSPIGSTPGYGGGVLIASMNQCLGIWDATGRTSAWFNGATFGANATGSIAFTNCTFYEDAGTSNLVTIFDQAFSSGVDAGTITCHSNLVWVNTTGSAPSGGLFLAGSAGSTSVTYAGVINSNVLLGGPDFSIGDLGAAGWYELPWDANDDDSTDPDVWPLDTVEYGVENTDVFNDPDSTYEWEMPNGLTLTVLKDLRPKKYQTAGYFGALPGALPSAPSGASSDDTDAGGGDPDDPATIPYLDVVPFYAPVLQYSLNARLSTERNRVKEFYLRRDRELKGFREWSGRRIDVAASTAERMRSGIETAELVWVDSDNAVALNAGPVEDVYLPPAKQVLVAGGAYSILKIQNQSASSTATTLFMAVD